MSSLSYEKLKDMDGEHYKFNWTFPTFPEGIREYRTEASSDGRPQIRIQILGSDFKKSLVEFSYMFPKDVIMKGIISTTGNQLSGSIVLQVVKAEKWNNFGSVYGTNFLHNNINNRNRNVMYPGQTSSNFTLNLKLTVEKYLDEKTLEDPTKSMNFDYENILKSGDFADVVIKSVDGKQFKAHRFVLMARSAVLKALFSHETTENETNLVETHFEAEVLEQVLLYLYTDKIPKIRELGNKILVAADYYQLDGLKKVCVKELCRSLPEEISKQMLELADSCQATELKQIATKFLRKLQFFAGHLDDEDWEVMTCSTQSD